MRVPSSFKIVVRNIEAAENAVVTLGEIKGGTPST